MLGGRTQASLCAEKTDLGERKRFKIQVIGGGWGTLLEHVLKEMEGLSSTLRLESLSFRDKKHEHFILRMEEQGRAG